MSLTRVLYRDSVFFFAFFLASAVVAFWSGYLSVIADESLHHHVHGIVMTLWLSILICQAFLIRSGRRALHAQVGRLSYVLAPLVLFSIIVIAHLRAVALPGAGRGDELLALQLISGVPFFALTYGLAILKRSDTAAHARFMLCTPLPMTGPIFNRILSQYFGVSPAGTFTLPAVDLLLFGLSVWDWKTNRRMSFPCFWRPM